MRKSTVSTTPLGQFDDLLTQLLIDHQGLWFQTRKFHPDYLKSKKLNLDLVREVQCVIFDRLVVRGKINEATIEILRVLNWHNLLPKDGSLSSKSTREHINRFLSIYHPDAGYELCNTNQYLSTVTLRPGYTRYTQDASILATRSIPIGTTLNHLKGLFSPLSPSTLDSLKSHSLDFSVMISSRTHRSCLLLGPARFVNHDCNPNTAFHFLQPHIITFKAVRKIRFGEEVTVSYGDNYFGPGNRECLCRTCKSKNKAEKDAKVIPSPIKSKRYRTRKLAQPKATDENGDKDLLPKLTSCESNYRPLTYHPTPPTDSSASSEAENDPRLMNLDELEKDVAEHPLMESFVKGFELDPPLAATLDVNQCQWCHNPTKNKIVCRKHAPLPFLPSNQSQSSMDVSQYADIIHHLGSGVPLCLRCNRHYEVFSLPWPYREYPKRVQKAFTKMAPVSPPMSLKRGCDYVELNTQPEPVNEVIKETEVKHEPLSSPKPRSSTSDTRHTTPSLTHATTNTNPNTPSEVNLYVIPRTLYSGSGTQRDLVFVDPWSTSESLFWPCIVVPTTEVDTATMMPLKDKNNYFMVRRLDTGAFHMVDKRGTYQFDPHAFTFKAFLSQDSQFLERPGIRDALCFYETGLPPPSFMWRKWRTNYAADQWQTHYFTHHTLRKRVPPMSYTQEREYINIHEIKCQAAAQAYSKKRGYKGLATFPKEGYLEKMIQIESIHFNDGNDSAVTRPNGMAYYVKILGTDTHRFISPNQLVISETNSLELETNIEATRLTRSKLRKICKPSI